MVCPAYRGYIRMNGMQVILLIWSLIGLFALYSIGAMIGGWRAGVDLILGLIVTVLWWGGWGTLIFYTVKYGSVALARALAS